MWKNPRNYFKFLMLIFAVAVGGLSASSGLLSAWQETESQETQVQEKKQEVTPVQDKDSGAVAKPEGVIPAAEVPEDILQFMEELNAALKTGSARRLTSRISVPTLVKAMREMTLLPEMEEAENQKFIEALQAGLRSHVGRFTQMAWHEAKWIRFERLSDDRVILLGRHYDEDGVGSPIRWWLVREDDKWKFYDLEMLDVNIRFSYFAGLGFTAGVNQSPWVRQFTPLLSLIEQLQTGMLDEDELEDLIDLASDLLDEVLHADIPVEIRSFLMLYRALALVSLEELDEALSQLDRLEKLGVEVPILHQVRADIYSHQERYQLAIKSLITYGQLLGFDASVHESLSDAYLELGEQEKAAHHARQGLLDQPLSLGCLASLGAALPPNKTHELEPHFAKHDYDEYALVMVIDWCLVNEQLPGARFSFKLLKKHHPNSESIEEYRSQLDSADY